MLKIVLEVQYSMPLCYLTPFSMCSFNIRITYICILNINILNGYWIVLVHGDLRNGGSVLLMKKREVSYFCLGKFGYFQKGLFHQIIATVCITSLDQIYPTTACRNFAIGFPVILEAVLVSVVPVHLRLLVFCFQYCLL